MDSDDDFIMESSGDERAHNMRSGAKGKAGGRGGNRPAKKVDPNKRAAWEDVQRSWDQVKEGADGSLAATVAGLLEASKRKRLLRDTTPIQRGIIRHMTLVLDVSSAMVERDLRPTRFLLMMKYTKEFITEYFEQNPISQLSIIAMHDGVTVRISDMAGNPTEHLTALQKCYGLEPKGAASLQNALQMARAALFHTPLHGTREILIIFGALSSADPGDIHQTLEDLLKDKIQIRIVGLAAQVAVCRELCMKTNSGDDSTYGVVLHEQHFRDLFLEGTTPPITRTEKLSKPSLLMMGFPSRIVEEHASFCACHANLTKGGYLCPRCSSKVCQLPIECPVCDMTLVLSTHLARSYHHLFPLKNWVEVPRERARDSTHCFACLTTFPPSDQSADLRSPNAAKKGAPKGASDGARKPQQLHPELAMSQRYMCPDCGAHFCIDCDIFAHETLHNCPSCQAGHRVAADADAPGESAPSGAAGRPNEGVSMDVD